jgi:phosphatidylinositol alpha-1,6-mannosyltransferase
LEHDVSEKTLFVTNDFGPRAGGIETFIIGLIERLPKSSIIVYTSAQEDCADYDAQWMHDFGVEVIRDRSKILLPTPRVNRAVAKIIRDRAIATVAFGAAAPLAWMSATLRRAGATRIVALTHGHEVWWSKLFPFNLIMRRIGQTTNALTYLGEFTRNAISKSLSKKSAAAMVKIAPGIDTEHFKPVDARDLREFLGLRHKKVIVSVGRLVHRKGQDFLIESMPLILQSVPDAHVLLVGQGPYRQHLEALVKKHGLTDNVTFIGRIHYADLPRYICVGDVFAMPSRSRFAGLEVEGLGIVYLEASSCGLPVVAGKSGGAPDAVLEGKTGFVVEGTDCAQIAKRVSELLVNDELRQSMGSAGREWIIKEWRWQIWAKRFAELLAG